MIQAKYDRYSSMVESCRVHDVVLDLIRSLSSEENFVTVWNGVGQPPSTPVRRIYISSNGNGDLVKLKDTMNTEHVRSVVVFLPDIDHVPTFRNCTVLHILDLEGCDISEGYNLEYLGNIVHLRYLGLKRTGIGQLPEEISNLQYLQMLNIKENKISNLPSSIVRLTNLMCLIIDDSTRVPKGFGSLTTLENLSELGITSDWIDVTEEVGRLTNLKSLEITILEEIERRMTSTNV